MSITKPSASPYKGLVPYSEEDESFFFGRNGEREVITANLMASRLTLLYGASGVGKSSVLRAGVVPHLRQLALQNVNEHGTPEFAVVVFSSWRDNPVAMLEEQIYESVSGLPTQDEKVQFQYDEKGRINLVKFLEACTRRIGADFIIILDQFEEYFLYHSQEDGEGTFVVEFPRAVNRPDLRVNFLISIREDALAKLDRFKGRIPNLFDNYLRIEHLDREAAREAIEKPIEEFNRQNSTDFRIEPALLDAVLDQVKTGQVFLGEAGRGLVKSENGEARIETPYLQLVMTRLWNEEMSADSHVLRLDTLNSLGRAENIVKTHLDETMNALPPGEKDAAASVFRYLVTPSGTKIAHSIPDLAEYGKIPQTQLEPILDKLSRGEIRILRPVAPPPDHPGATRYEIFHDVLAPAILDWRRRYVEEQERERIRLEEQKRREQEQAETERKRELERARRLRWVVGGLSIIVIVMFASLIFATKQRILAQHRLNRILDSIKLKQAALSGNQGEIDAVLNSSLRNNQIVFRASAKPRFDDQGRPIYNRQGKLVYDFELYPDKNSIPEGEKTIAYITYKLDHPTFRNSLLLTGPDINFRASYNGWGCLRQVIAVIEYVNPDKTPAIASFNMCKALGWR